MKREEGFIKTLGGKVWYIIVGNKNAIPLLVLHGGPGYPHDSLEPLEDLARDRKVIFYDQLGCGNSQKSDEKFWTLEYFLEELREIIKQLSLKEYVLLGHSWGAGLATSFATSNPPGLKGLILADPFLSTPIWQKDANRLLKTLPENFQKALTEGPDHPNYKEASDEFYYQFLYREKVLSTATLKAEFKMNLDLYNHMWGPSEFKATGTLKNFDLSKQLKKIKTPTLLICGKYDEATPESTEYFTTQIPNSEMKIFLESAHMPHWTEREHYIKTIRAFLNNL